MSNELHQTSSQEAVPAGAPIPAAIPVDQPSPEALPVGVGTNDVEGHGTSVAVQAPNPSEDVPLDTAAPGESGGMSPNPAQASLVPVSQTNAPGDIPTPPHKTVATVDLSTAAESEPSASLSPSEIAADPLSATLGSAPASGEVPHEDELDGEGHLDAGTAPESPVPRAQSNVSEDSSASPNEVDSPASLPAVPTSGSDAPIALPPTLSPLATNEASATGHAITNIPPQPPPAQPDNHPDIWLWVLVVLIVVAVVAWLAKKLKENTAAFEKSAEDEILDSVLNVVARDAPNRGVLRQELSDAVEHGGMLRTGVLADILRIEESYEKRSAGRYLRRISVLRRKTGTTASLTKIESELDWEYIPEAIREQFIKARESKVVRLVYDAGKGTET